MDIMRNENDPSSFIFDIVSQTSIVGPVPLRKVLMQIYEKWHLISAKRKLEVECPIRFTKEQMIKAREAAEEWAKVFNQFESLRLELLGKDGWVSHEEYEEAKARFDQRKGDLENLRKRLDELALIY